MIAVTYTSSPLVINEQIVGTIFAFRDMTERERELESLRQSEDQYRSVVEASPDSMWLSDLYGFIIMANKRAAEMFGYAAPRRCSTWAPSN
jgi:two-component system sensor histidine kinase/response regulator